MPERHFPASELRRLAVIGEALPDGTHPTPDEHALADAIRDADRAPADRQPELRRYLARRAAALGRTDLIPPTWEARAHA